MTDTTSDKRGPMSEANLTIYRNQVIVNDYLSKMRGELIDEIDRLRAENAALKREVRSRRSVPDWPLYDPHCGMEVRP